MELGQQIQIRTGEDENKKQTDTMILPKKKMTRQKQFDLFKKKGGMHVIRKFVPGTEEDAKKWESPKDWANWSLKRIKENRKNLYGMWVVFFFYCWVAEMEVERTDPDSSLVLRAKSIPQFWKKICKYPYLEFNTPDISRRSLYTIRQVTGLPDYRGRIELICKWKNL